MAMTGGTAYKVKTSSAAGFTIDLYVYVVVGSYNVAANTTPLKLGMYVSTPGSAYDINWGDYEGSYLGVSAYNGGSEQKRTFTADGRGGGTLWLAENKEVTVSHAADGTASNVPIIWKWGVNSSWGGYVIPSGSFTVSLPRIPRTSTVSAPSSGTIGTSTTLSISRQDSSFTHTLKYTFGSTSGTIATKTTSTSVAWTPPMSLCSQISSKASDTCTITCETYSGNTLIGSSTCTMTLAAPKSTVSANSGAIGTALSITISRNTSAYTHTLKYTFGGASGTITSKTSSTSVSWTPPTSLCGQISSAASGTCTITCETYSGNTLVGSSTCAMTLTAPKSTVSASSGTIGTELTVTISRNTSAYTHTLTYAFSGTSGTIASKTTSTAVSWTPPMNLCDQISNVASGSCTITCETYSGNTLVGTSTCTITLSAPKSTVSATSGVIGTEIVITINRNTSAYTHTLKYAFGSASGTIKEKTSSTSVSWTPPASLSSQVSGASGSCTITCETYSGSTKVGSSTCTITLSLPASTVSTSASGTIGTSLTISISRQSSSFTHTLKYTFGSTSGTIATKTSSASVSWTPPASLCNQISTAVSGTCTIICETYSGSTKIGESACTVVLSAPKSTVSASSGAIGTPLIVTIGRNTSAYTHTLKYAFGSASGTIVVKTSSVSVEWTPPMSLYDQILGSVSGACTITCETYNGNTLVGTSSCQITLSVIGSTVSATDGVIGKPIEITIDRNSSAYTHTLKYKFGSTSGTIIAKISSVSVFWTPPVSLCSQISSAASGTCTITCETYSGNALVGSSTCTTTLSVPHSGVSAATVGTIGTALTITIDRKTTAYTHTLKYSFGRVSEIIAVKTKDTAVSWTPPMGLYDEIAGSTSGACVITCETYNGDNLVGTSTCEITLSAIGSAVSAHSGVIGSEITITIARNTASYTHTIKYKFVNETGTIVSKTADTSVLWATPMSLCNQISGSSSGTCTITCETYSGNALIGTSSCTIMLTAPGSSVTAAYGTIGAALSITISKNTSAYTHTLKYEFGSETGTIATKTSSSAISWTPPMRLCSQIPNDVSGLCTITCETYSGNSIIQTETTATMLSVPASVKLDLLSGWATVAADNAGTAASGITGYVQGFSKAQVSFDSSKISTRNSYGAGVKSYRVVYDGKDIYSPYKTGVLQSAGTFSIICYVTDTRDRTQSTTLSFTVPAYTTPTLSDISLFRCDSEGNANEAGTYYYIKATAHYSSLNGENSVTLRYRHKVGTGSYSAYSSLTSGVGLIVGDAVISTESTYTVEISAIDELGNPVVYTGYLLSEEVAFHIRRGGKGAALGKLAEQDDLFDVAWNQTVRKSLNVAENLNVSGDIYIGDVSLKDLLAI